MSVPVKRALALLCVPLLAAGVAACGSASGIAGFKGEEHNVAQTISNLQADATARDEGKVCDNDLASTVVTRLDAAAGGCKQAIKDQLSEVDTFELTVESVQVNDSGKVPTATARVKSVHAGKTELSTVSLVKEDGQWKISSLQ